MKQNFLLIIISILMIDVNAQTEKVGINTNTPEAELHVNGTMKTNGLIINNQLEKLGAAEDYSFLIKSPSPEDKITSYNQEYDAEASAPINLIQFKITGDPADKDWVNQFDTKINANKFTVIIASFGFTLAVKDSYGAQNYTPVPQIYAFKNGGTWKLKADYEGFAPPETNEEGIWTINLVVFDNAYTNEASQTQDISGQQTASSPSPLIQ